MPLVVASLVQVSFLRGYCPRSFAAMCSRLIDFVSKRIQYITVMESCGAAPGSQKHQQLVLESIAGVANTLRSLKNINVEDLMTIRDLCKDKFNEEQLKDLTQALEVKVMGPSSDGKQTHAFLDNYLPEALWDLFKNPANTTDTKLFTMAGFFTP